ncbi:MAG: hypothetical protein M3483_03140 [Gemmatimonadota bacterium]|nr:hypothetical protein [Gemmatimonadota bacterium]
MNRYGRDYHHDYTGWMSGQSSDLGGSARRGYAGQGDRYSAEGNRWGGGFRPRGGYGGDYRARGYDAPEYGRGMPPRGYDRGYGQDRMRGGSGMPGPGYGRGDGSRPRGERAPGFGYGAGEVGGSTGPGRLDAGRPRFFTGYGSQNSGVGYRPGW